MGERVPALGGKESERKRPLVGSGGEGLGCGLHFWAHPYPSKKGGSICIASVRPLSASTPGATHLVYFIGVH